MWGRLRSLAAVVAAGSVAIAGTALGGGSAPTTPLTVRVDAKDFSFALSRRSVPKGATVRFVVRNRGGVPHDFVVSGRRTRLLQPGKSQVLTVRFPTAGTFSFLCSVPGHARLGMKGRFAVARPAPPVMTTKPPPVDLTGAVKLTQIGTFDRPVLVTAPPGDTRRLFVVEQAGRIRVVEDGEALPQPFLDIVDRVLLTNEPGLLGLAFSPDWATTKRFTILFNQRKGNGDILIANGTAYAANPNLADPGSLTPLLEIVKPWENHNGGMLQYGPDGMLYASIGDGDSGVRNRPGAFAQTRDDLLGNILRVDPRSGDPYGIPPDNPFLSTPDVRPEIWAYGLRNPWRFWIDPPTGDFYLGDVGLGTAEEIDYVPAGTSGVNFGWPCFEGTTPYDATVTCDGPVPPVLTYGHDQGECSVIGGVVVRDPRLPALNGVYLYADLCAGRILATRVENGVAGTPDDLGIDLTGITSFGVDGAGAVYVTTVSGPVYRLDPPS